MTGGDACPRFRVSVGEQDSVSMATQDRAAFAIEEGGVFGGVRRRVEKELFPRVAILSAAGGFLPALYRQRLMKMVLNGSKRLSKIGREDRSSAYQSLLNS